MVFLAASDNMQSYVHTVDSFQLDIVNTEFFNTPIQSSSFHTMSKSLDRYVDQRIPLSLLIETIKQRKPVRFYGVYPDDLSVLKQYTSVKERIFKTHSTDKHLNFIRPKYFSTDQGMVVLIVPGRDYISHYVSMFKYAVSKIDDAFLSYIQVYFNDEIEVMFPRWTGLYDFIYQGDIVVMGYVDEIYHAISSHLTFMNSQENHFYRMGRFHLGGKNICFLGVKYSFWGNLSGVIAKHLCNLGVSEIIYSAKLGDMIHPNNLYSKVYSATSFYLMNNHRLLSHVSNSHNPLVKLFPELDSGAHVSVPTVLEELYCQRGIAKSLGINSIDNEASHIMKVVSDFNQTSTKQVSYFNLHFSTDYVRCISERNLKINFDLSNNRTSSALLKKQRILQKISDYLLYYFLY